MDGELRINVLSTGFEIISARQELAVAEDRRTRRLAVLLAFLGDCRFAFGKRLRLTRQLAIDVHSALA